MLLEKASWQEAFDQWLRLNDATRQELESPFLETDFLDDEYQDWLQGRGDNLKRQSEAGGNILTIIFSPSTASTEVSIEHFLQEEIPIWEKAIFSYQRAKLRSRQVASANLYRKFSLTVARHAWKMASPKVAGKVGEIDAIAQDARESCDFELLQSCISRLDSEV